MSRTNQLDLHPDAESLNAFVEHLLPEQERQRILAHTAACSRCRQVIYLAQEAAVDADQPAPESLISPIPAKRSVPWFTNLRFALASVTACVALITLSIFLYPKRTPSTHELAKLASPEQGALSKPALQSRIPEQAEKKQTSPKQSISRQPVMGTLESTPHPLSRASAGNAAPRTALSQFQAPPQPSMPTAPPMPATPLTTANIAVGITEAGTQIVAPRPPLTQTMPTQPNASLSLNSPSTNSAQVQTEQALKAQPPHSQRAVGGPMAKNAVSGSLHNAASRMKPSQTTAVNGAATPVGLDAMYLRSPVNADALSNADLIAAHNAMHMVLPSGLTAVSTAAAQHHLLAIDATGALFLSEDLGKNWEPVVQQWTGHAIEVRVHRTPNSDAAAFSAGQAAATPSDSASLFEIVNDGASTWTSVDGKTWKSK
jgi:hypothetical protein